MIQTSARLLQMLSLLQARRFWSARDLASDLGITERSVRRDVDRLRRLGYPVHATAGVGGGYQMGAGKEMPPLPLDDEEATAVAVGMRAAATGRVKGLEEAAVRALGKLERVLPKHVRRKVNALQVVSVQLGDSGPTVGAEALMQVAAQQRRAVNAEPGREGLKGERCPPPSARSTFTDAKGSMRGHERRRSTTTEPDMAASFRSMIRIEGACLSVLLLVAVPSAQASEETCTKDGKLKSEEYFEDGSRK